VPGIFAESQSYYLLGFERTPGDDPSRRRSVRVRVNRDNVTVRSRSGYFATSPAPPTDAGRTPADDSLAALLPRTDVPLTLALVPRFRNDGTPVVAVQFGIAEGTRDEYRLFGARVAVLDDRGRAVGSATLEVEANPSSAGSDVVLAQTTLPMEPGRYEVRIGVGDVVNGRAGSVHGYVDVETDRRLAIGGITLAVGPDASIGAARGDPFTLRRTFARSEVVTALTQVRRHDGDRPAPPVTRIARIVDTRDQVVHEERQLIETFNQAGVADMAIPLPVSDLPSGRYLLTIDVGFGGQPESQRRDLMFDVDE